MAAETNCLPLELTHSFWRWLMRFLSPLAESRITGGLQETARHGDIAEDNCVVTANSPTSPNSIDDKDGDQDDPNLNADADGLDDPSEARNRRAGDLHIAAPVDDAVLQILVDLPQPKQNWIYPKLETI